MIDPKERIKLLNYWFEEIQENMKEEDFQRDFMESLNDQYLARGTLSDKQFECVRRIYERVTA